MTTRNDPGPLLRSPARRDLRVLMSRAKNRPWYGQEAVHPRHVLATTALTEPGRPVRLLLTYDAGHHACSRKRVASSARPIPAMSADLYSSVVSSE